MRWFRSRLQMQQSLFRSIPGILQPQSTAASRNYTDAMEHYENFAKEVSANQTKFINRLREAVSIPSVSGQPQHRSDVVRMVQWTKKQLEKLGTKVELQNIGKQTFPDGTKLDLPPVLFGTLGNDKAKKTLLIYGHLDVQPAAKTDGWNTEPFSLTEKDGKLYGRGATDDKGPVVAWINALEMLHKCKIPLPVNIKMLDSQKVVVGGVPEERRNSFTEKQMNNRLLYPDRQFWDNLMKFCFEAMEESGSVGLEEALKSKKDTFLKDVNFTCISDSYWLGKTKPCISYGLRFQYPVMCSETLKSSFFVPTATSSTLIGEAITEELKPVSVRAGILIYSCKLTGLCYYFIEVSGCKQDLHSGVFGGSMYEPMSDVVWMMSQLTDMNGNIKIDGLQDLVAPVTEEEKKLYENLDFDVEEYRVDIGAVKLISEKKEEILMNRWRNPSLSLHGIEGAFSGEGAKTIIPAKVIGKFSIRLVPNMEPAKVDRIVVDHLNALWKTRGSPNHFKARPLHSGLYWLSDFKDPHCQCGARAIKKVYGVEPDYIREGGSIPITITFQELTGGNVLLLPIGASDDMAHSQNEKINLRNYMEGVKLLGAYLLELKAL